MRYLLALALAGVIFSVKAQEIIPLDPGRLVETACVGECGERDVMNYRVPAYAGDERMTFMVDRYHLRPDFTAMLRITVDGKEVKHLIINPQTIYSFVAPSGSHVRIAIKARSVNRENARIKGGDVVMSLYAAEVVGVEPYLPPRPFKN